MITEKTLAKLKILAEAAKYDASCASSGSSRRNTGGVGNAQTFGCCHSFTEDGRCVSLLKVLFTNHCCFDCAYCLSRTSNDIPRAAFTVSELAELTMAFYKRNYIEGLFLSSGVLRNADFTMERMLAVLRQLRHQYRFNGYIHMKCIPGCSPELVHQAGLLADRLSVNVEIPLEPNLKKLAPDKNHKSVFLPMRSIHTGILQNVDERKRFRNAPNFAPAGQSTQLIIGASNESDKDILTLSSRLYTGPALKRVYYSGFVPVNLYDGRLPGDKPVPLQREHRLYQADWLIRLYEFDCAEIVDDKHPELDLEVDPKIAWALRHPEYFPLDVNRAEYHQLIRIPGLGIRSAKRIVHARRIRKLTHEHLTRLGVVMRRARFFITPSSGPSFTIQEAGPDYVRRFLTNKTSTGQRSYQLSLFDNTSLALR